MYGPPPPGSAAYMLRSPSTNDFQIEKVARTPAPKPSFPLPPEIDSLDARDEVMVYRETVNKMLDMKAKQFAVMGRVPCDSSQLVLFFRSKVCSVFFLFFFFFRFFFRFFGFSLRVLTVDFCVNLFFFRVV